MDKSESSIPTQPKTKNDLGFGLSLAWYAFNHDNLPKTLDVWVPRAAVILALIG